MALIRRGWKLDSPVYRKTLFFIMIPALIVTLLLYFTYRISIHILTEQVRTQTYTELQDSSRKVEDVFESTFHLAHMIASDKTVTGVFQRTGYSEYIHCVDALRRYEISNPYLDSIFLVDTASGIAVSKDGLYLISELFSKYHRYQDYSATWYSDIVTYSTQFRIRPVSAITNAFTNYNKRVMPFIITKAGAMKSGQILLINVNGDAFEEILQNSGVASFFIFDQDAQLYFGKYTNDEALAYAVRYMNQLSMDDIQNNRSDITELSNENDDIFLVHAPGYSALNNYYYLSYVPRWIIVSKLDTIRNMFYLATLICCFIPIFSFFLSRRLYAPLDKLMRSLPIKDSRLNEYSAISAEIRALEFRKAALEQDILFALPYVCEKYILSIVYQTDPAPDHKATDFLKSYGIVFAHDYFCTCLTYLREGPSVRDEDFSQKYFLINKIARMLNEDASSVTSYSFMMNSYAICSIVNLSTADDLDKVRDCFEKISAEIAPDGYKVCTGIGNAYRGMSGMNKSFKESDYLLTLFRTQQSSGVLVFDTDRLQSKYRYTLPEESKLGGFLYAGKTADALDFLAGIVSVNTSIGISENELKHLCFHLYVSISRVVKERRLVTRELMGADYLPFSENYTKMSVDEIMLYFEKMIRRICQIGSGLSGHMKVDVEAVQQYILSNFATDLFIEKFAEQYNVSASYFSKCFKEATGGGFYDYVSAVRIKKAQEMLLESLDSVERISQRSGFNSRQTFIRMFKKLTGSTPAQYRARHRSSAIIPPSADQSSPKSEIESR